MSKANNRLTNIACRVLIVLLATTTLLSIKDFHLFPQAVAYRLSMSLGPVHGLDGKPIELSDDTEGGTEDDAVGGALEPKVLFPNLSRHVHLPRYSIFHPALEFAETFGLNSNLAFSAMIGLLFAAYLFVLFEILSLLAVRSWLAYGVATLLSFAAFASMNGRAAAAFLGFSILVWIVVSGLRRLQPNLALAGSAFALYLCSMSTGLYGVGLTLFFLGRYPPLSSLNGAADQAGSVVVPPSVATRTAEAAMVVIALSYLFLLLEKLSLHFGGGLGLLTGVLNHGIVRLFPGGLPVFIAVALVGAAIGAFALFRLRTWSGWSSISKRTLGLACLTVLPLPFLVVGMTAGSLFLVGATLSAAVVANEFAGAQSSDA